MHRTTEARMKQEGNRIMWLDELKLSPETPKEPSKLEDELGKYVSDTLSCIKTIKHFVSGNLKWIEEKEEEKCTLAKIPEKLSEIHNSNNYNIIPAIASRQRAEDVAKLQTELEDLIQKILKGLKEIKEFLEAVEKLAVTSVKLFNKNQVLQLCDQTDLESVKMILHAARIIRPHLLLFKRDDKEFFKAKLHNVEVMENQMNQYIRLIKNFCNAFKECSVADLSLTRPTLVLKPDLSEDDVEKNQPVYLPPVSRLITVRAEPDEGGVPQPRCTASIWKSVIHLQVELGTLSWESLSWSRAGRMVLNAERKNDIHFRLVVLFGDENKTFMEKFSEKKERMHKFLNDLEPCAVQLDSMNKGARISTVVSSSVGVVGGGLSIAGLALAPFTAGLSLGLTIAGAATAGTSVLNSVVTMITDKVVSSVQTNKANETLKNFMDDVNDLQNCLREAIIQHLQSSETYDFQAAVDLAKNGASVTKSIDIIIDCFPLYKLVKAEKALVNAAGTGQAVGQAASEIPVLGQAALKGPLALGKAARGGYIALNALFIGVDIFWIANESVCLSQGSETEISKWIRARADLWRRELEEGLNKYVSETFSHMKRVKNFIVRSNEWIKERQKEKSTLEKIPEKADDIHNRQNLQKQAEEQRKLQMELERLMRSIRKGLNEMQHFLEAVEKLAVTSVKVFDQNQVLQLSEETDLESVKKILFAAQLVCPLLLLFKRSHKPHGFFGAKVDNVEVIRAQLKQYIFSSVTSVQLSEDDLSLTRPTLVLKPDLSEDDVERVLINTNTLHQISDAQVDSLN
ncbi:hypothetical protein WMY93_020933 [Mugilogobius chulae]|uniref:Apolipoprotein L3-like n=1 Tax=Mugilogobius chulae TaxID=88201 RepID=A0AAW0NLG9_9GOBI